MIQQHLVKAEVVERLCTGRHKGDGGCSDTDLGVGLQRLGICTSIHFYQSAFRKCRKAQQFLEAQATRRMDGEQPLIDLCGVEADEDRIRLPTWCSHTDGDVIRKLRHNWVEVGKGPGLS